MHERLPDLGLGIKGIELQPEEERNRDQRENIRVTESEREETCCLRDGVVNRDCVVAILRFVQ